tara:strand:+ start:220 stop:705 length:486 start_codon:yes stop_codon:yes gene_type:complete
MRHSLFLLAGLLVFVTSCARGIEVKEAIQITDVKTGWYDAGIMADGKNKLVPSILFQVTNISDKKVARVQFNAVFRRMDEEDTTWGEHFVRGIGADGLEPGATGGDIVLRSNLGYTGTQSRSQMLQNQEFVDARVEVFGRSGPRPWIRVGEYQIDRQLLTR